MVLLSQPFFSPPAASVALKMSLEEHLGRIDYLMVVIACDLVFITKVAQDNFIS